ncbi:uncharacterized protein LOC143152408 isoform X2 [Ptiloglossa arizonensis]|uniref:uncharacterized protein LOC143152408 isoform X2 n=1 Tax=Ptiloglossa arizonensis TaxID=3350558 RepID=UPI003F9FA7A8
MDESTNVAEKAVAQVVQLSNPDSDEERANCSGTDDANSLKVPQRKQSVFCRPFHVIATKNQGEACKFRRICGTSSVRLERYQDGESWNQEARDQTSTCKKGFVNNCCSLIESGRFLSPSPKKSKSNVQSSPTTKSSLKLPRVAENSIVDRSATITSIAKHFESGTNDDRKDVVESRATELRENSSPDDLRIVSIRDERLENGGGSGVVPAATGRFTADHGSSECSGIRCNDLAKIKDSPAPRGFPCTASSGARLGKYTPVDPEMSSHEESSIGSEDNEEDPIVDVTTDHDRTIGNEVAKIADIPSRPSSSFSIDENTRKPDSSEAADERKTEDFPEFQSTPEKRQRFSTARRSLSEGDSEQYHGTRRCCKCGKQESENREQVRAFPSFNDTRLQTMRLSNPDETNAPCREIAENELERRYIAFSIGLSTDRITLHRRLTLSRRQRDLSERNFTSEIKKMQEDIQELSPLCTDRDSMEKVEKVRSRLDTIKKCARRTCYASETLGAVQQEQRVCGGVFIADKYLRTLRSRCESLATEIAEIKRILLMHNIVIEEGPREMCDDVSKLRYSNNRAMVSRRRASIATISGPIFSQDMIKEGPRQRNSVSGRVSLITQRRPSLCSEMQRWENDKLNRTDSNSVAELRDISEQTESRRNSLEENNNLLRHVQISNTETVNCHVSNNVENEDRPSSSSSFLESSMTKNVENQLKSCIRKAEPLRIPKNLQTWRPILWCALIFFLGYYTNYITSSVNTCEHISITN